MLGAIGFAVVGLCFGIFAYTFYNFVAKGTGITRLKWFSFAYVALAATFLLWAVACMVNDSALLGNAVFAGNVLILVGTLCLFNLLPHQYRRALLVGGLFVGVALLWLRATYFWPVPYMADGILFLNAQQPVAITFGVLLALVWLPINIYVARVVAHAIGRDDMALLYTLMYSVATFASIMFLAAKQPALLIASFVALGVCFAVLVASNFVARTLKGSHARAK